MEKDFFKDRDTDATIKNKIIVGNEAFICLKQNQKIAETISDLTRITVTRHLTSQENHPRGCKVMGENIERDIFGHYLAGNDYLRKITQCVGRCTYLLHEGKINTSEGFKTIYYNINTGKQILVKEEKLKNKLKISVNFKYDNYLICCPLFPYVYFDDICSIKSFISQFFIDKCCYKNGFMFIKLNNTFIRIEDYDIIENNEVIDKKQFIDKNKTILLTPFNFSYKNSVEY